MASNTKTVQTIEQAIAAFELSQLAPTGTSGVYVGKLLGYAAFGVAIGGQARTTKKGKLEYARVNQAQLDAVHKYGLAVTIPAGQMPIEFGGPIGYGNILAYVKPGKYALFLVDLAKPRGSNSEGTGISVAASSEFRHNAGTLSVTLWVNRAANGANELAALEQAKAQKAIKDAQWGEKVQSWQEKRLAKSSGVTLQPQPQPQPDYRHASEVDTRPALQPQTPVTSDKPMSEFEIVMALGKKYGYSAQESVAFYQAAKAAGMPIEL
jgi:hypothetical protein